MHVAWRDWIKRYKNYIFIGLLVALGLKVIVPQLDDLKESLAALREADLYWITLGIVVYFSGIPVLALQFMALALKKITFLLTLKVEMAGQFVGKLLPIGLGMISLNLYYLIKKQHTPTEAAAVMSVNAVTSAIAYSFLIILALMASTPSLDGLKGDVHLPPNLIWFLLIVLIGIAYVLYRFANLRAKIRSSWRDIKKGIGAYKHRKTALLTATICNGVGSFTSLFALYASAQAINVDLSLASALLAYTFGNVASSLVPTPGGIGAAEAGIYSGLVLTGMDGSDAITVTLLYRLISYWLPIIPGYYFFWGLRKNVLAKFNVKKKYAS